jgi:hypothetical protein
MKDKAILSFMSAALFTFTYMGASGSEQSGAHAPRADINPEESMADGS